MCKDSGQKPAAQGGELRPFLDELANWTKEELALEVVRLSRRPAPMTPQGASEEVKALVEAYGEAAGQHYWEQDQGWVDTAIVAASKANDATKADLLAYIARLEAPHPQQERAEEWECFCDESYYDMWAVRPKGDRSFQSQQLFHLPSKEEAEALRDILSRRADERGKP